MYSTFFLITIPTTSIMGRGYNRKGPSHAFDVRKPLFYHRLGLEHGFTVEYDAACIYNIIINYS